MILLFLFFVVKLLPIHSEVHDFHVSRCEINYETKTDDIQIAVHIFIDDLENALKLTGIQNLYIGTAKEHMKADDYINKYVQSKFFMTTTGKQLKLQYLGKELSEDAMAVWCYFEIPDNKNIRELRIDNKILMELFNDQKNIIDFTINNKKKYFTIVDAKKSFIEYKW